MALQLPRAGLPGVSPQPVQAPRVRPTMDERNFGGGQATGAAFGQARGLAGDVANITSREEMRAQEAQFNELVIEAEKEEQARKSALSKLQGKDALKGADDALAQFDKFASELDKKATSQQVKDRLKLRLERNRMGLQGFAEPYARGQMEKYEAEVFSSSLDNIENSAVQGFSNPLQVALKIDEQQAAIKRHAALTGKPKEWAASEIAKRESRIHQGVINQYLAAGNDIDAKNYFTANKDGILGLAQAGIQANVEEGSSEGVARRAVDGFMESASSFKDLMAKARGLKDDKVRAKAEQYAKVRWHELQEERREERKALVTEAFKRIDKDDGKAGSAYELLTPAIYNSLDKDEKELAEKEFRIKRGLEARATDRELYYALKTLGANGDTREEFLKDNLLKYRHKLEEQDFKELITFQAGLIKQDGKTLKDADGYISKEQTINQFADTIIDKIQRVEFKSYIDKQIRGWQEGQKDKTLLPPKEEIEKMMRDVVKEGGYSTKYRTFQGRTPEQSQAEIDDVMRFQLAAEDIAKQFPDDFRQITEALQRAKIDPTPEKIVNMFEKGKGR